MKDVELKTVNDEFPCDVLGEKHGTKTEIVIINVVQKFIKPANSPSKFYHSQSFVDCPQKDNCGIYRLLSNGKHGHDWDKCPAKQKYP